MPKTHACQATVSFAEMSLALPSAEGCRGTMELFFGDILPGKMDFWLEADQAKRSAVIGFASGKQCRLRGLKAV